MRTFPIIIIVLLLLAAACQTHTPSYTITGKFDNAAQYHAYIHYINGGRLVPDDSLVIAADGSFTYKADSLKSPFILLSVVSPDKKVTQYVQLLVQPNEQISLGGDVLNELKTNYTVQGSPQSEWVKELNAALLQTTQKLEELAKEYKQAAAKGDVDSTSKAAFDQRNHDILLAHKTYSEKFINQHDSSLVSIMALFQVYNNREWVFNPQDDAKLFETVLKRMKPLYPTSEMVRTLEMMVTDQQTRAIEKQQHPETIELGTIAPEIRMPAPDGKEIALSNLRGKYVLIDFWAAWCRPCRRENPNLVQNYKKYHRKGFEIFQVSLDKDHDAWVKAIKDDKLSWYHVSDLQYWQSEAAKLYNVVNIPTNYLIDPEGRVIASNLRGKALEDKLRSIYLF